MELMAWILFFYGTGWVIAVPKFLEEGYAHPKTLAVFWPYLLMLWILGDG